PSGSCVLHIKDHLHGAPAGGGGGEHGSAAAGTTIPGKIYELVEFMTDVLRVSALDASFPFKVGIHQSCHGQRGLKLAQMSELMAPPFSKPLQLLKMVKGIQLISLSRQDECCGFGGTFCVAEEAVSVKMGKDRVADHLHHGAEYITGSDMSCLMHMEGILNRQKSAVRVKHIAEILNSRL
ncbi:MAG: (Fe-S)-binding protein, partial [Bacteroidetes bacterium]|nr:(Fe-S)-binding protein [Bacteroidota bacterium]